MISHVSNHQMVCYNIYTLSQWLFTSLTYLICYIYKILTVEDLRWKGFNIYIYIKKNGNLTELIGNNCIENERVKRAENTVTIGKCSPCISRTGNLYCSQLTSITTFISKQKKIKIYHKVNCRNEYVNYLMECTLCNKQYVRKEETVFNIR